MFPGVLGKCGGRSNDLDVGEKIAFHGWPILACRRSILRDLHKEKGIISRRRRELGVSSAPGPAYPFFLFALKRPRPAEVAACF